MSVRETLKGWEKFHSEHFNENQFELSPDLLFGLFLSIDSVAQSKRQAKTEIAEAVQRVAVYMRKQCVRRGIPLWPAVIQTKS
jgi:hypothetical protein